MANGLLGQYHLTGAEVEVDEKTSRAWRLIPASATANANTTNTPGGASAAACWQRHTLLGWLDSLDLFEDDEDPQYQAANHANHANHPNSANSGKNATIATSENHTLHRLPIRLSEADRRRWLHTTDPAARATLRLEDQDAKRAAATQAGRLKARLTNLAQTKDLPPAELRKGYRAHISEVAKPSLLRLFGRASGNASGH